MELDKRIIEGKKPLNCFDTEIAKQFIGKKGYFSNSLGWYSVLKSTWDGTLDDIESQQEQCFYDCESEGYFYYFLPAEWVKEPEKKYRPYTLDEFVNKYSLGDEIILKIKANNRIEHKLFIEYTEDAKNINTRMNICLGGFYYSLKDLFDKSELYTSEGWKPFGVEE